MHMFTNVGFVPTETANEVELCLNSDIYCSLGRRTALNAAPRNVVIPDLPPQFNEFQNVYAQRDRSLAGTQYIQPFQEVSFFCVLTNYLF